MIRGGATFIISVFLVTCIPGAISAQWIPNGTPVCTATGDQRYFDIIPDGARGAFLVWEDTRNGMDVYAQHVDWQGNAMWGADGLLICDAPDDQGRPLVTPDGDGGAIFVWRDSRNGNDPDLYAQRVDASGDTLWAANGKPIAIYAYHMLPTGIIPDGEHGAIVAWQDGRGFGTYPNDIYTQHIDSLGNQDWVPNGVGVCTEWWNQFDPRVVPDGSGGVFICWEDYRTTDTQVYAQRLDEDGTAKWTVGGDGIAFRDTTGDASFLEMVSDGAGGAIMVWQDSRGDVDIIAQRIDAQGNEMWPHNGVPVCDFTGAQRYAQIVPESGGALVVWQDDRGGRTDIFANFLTAAGTLAWDPDGMPVCLESHNQYYPHITGDGTGGAIITWQEVRYSSNSYDIYAQRIDDNGNRVWDPDGEVVCDHGSQQRDELVVSDGAGGALAVWPDQRNYDTNNYYDLYMSGVDENGDPKVPTFLASFDAEATGRGVTVRWTLSEVGIDAQFDAYRRELPEETYRRLVSPDIQGGGFTFALTDAAVVPGKKYRYRVDVTDEDGRRTLFETGPVDVPAASVLLAQNEPNPFNPSTSIRFYLPERTAVKLSVFDPRGRLVADLLDEKRAAGWHDVEWSATDRRGNRLSSGVYLYRLQAGKFVTSRKMTVLK